MTRPAGTRDCLAVVVEALGGQVGIDAGRIEPDQPLAAVPGIESIHVLRAITVIEETSGVLIPDDFLFETSTVRELAELVYQLAARPGSPLSAGGTGGTGGTGSPGPGDSVQLSRAAQVHDERGGEP